MRSRAAVKLRDLDRKFRIFRRGQRVVDLGCWPGGWLQIASERVGREGRVAGVDLVETEPFQHSNVHVFTGDAGKAEVRAQLLDALGGRPDVVLSDMSPKLTGMKAADQVREEAVAELALEIACELLSANGVFVIKLFSRVESGLTAELKRRFRSVSKLRPPSTRKGSSEIYAVASGLREPAADARDAAPSPPTGAVYPDGSGD